MRHGDFAVGARAAVTVVGACLVAVLLFPAVTAIRFAWQDGRLAIDLHRQGAYGSWLTAGVLGGLRRVNGLDPLLIIVSGKEIRPLQDVVHAGQMLQSGVNLVVPSALAGREPFPGVLPTSRAFSVVYRGQDRAYIDSHYQTDMWTFWGAAFAVAGWRYAAAVMFGIALFLGFGFSQIVGHGGRLGLLWRIWWLYSSYLVLISYGFDVDFGAAVSLLVGGATAVAVLRPRPVAQDARVAALASV